MKLIYPDSVSSITASAEDANYPAANLMDDHPKKVWKGTTNSATLTVNVGGAGALAIIATNAIEVTLSITPPESAQWDTDIEWDTGIEWKAYTGITFTETKYLSGTIRGAAWFEMSRTDSFSAEIVLTAAAGQVIQAGVVTAGVLREFRDPARGIKEGLRDYSIVKELNNGAFYTRKRDVVRTFGFSITEDRDTDFYVFMRDIARELGPDPAAWRILTNNVTGWEWIVFGRFDGLPQGAHSLPSYSQIDAKIVEVL